METKLEKIEALKKWMSTTRLDAKVNQKTLGESYDRISPAALLTASVKLIKINRNETEPDDRDHLGFSKFLTIEDYMHEQIDKDAGKWQKKAKMKLMNKRNLSWLHGGFFNPQIKAAIVGNTLTEATEGINPVAIYDSINKISKMGPGGISSDTAIPKESRQISESSYGFLDPVHVVESTRVGVVNHVCKHVLKGRDQKLYKLVKNNDNGKMEYVDHETLLDSVVGLPNT